MHDVEREPVWSVVLFPILVAGLGWAALRIAALDVLGPDAVRADDGRWFVALVVGSYAVLAVLERALPHRRTWGLAQGDTRTDVAHLALTGPLGGQLGLLLATALVQGGTAAGLPRLALWPSGWPPVAQLALALVLAEFGHYVFHRLSHEVGLVWRLHAVHHSAPRLHWLNATRFHPLDLVALTFCQSWPLLVLGIPPRAFLQYALFASCYGQLQHCNVALRSAGWSWLFSTPALHRWHHSTDPREGNTNYGAILSLWDHVFGTWFQPADRRFSGPVGIGDLPRFPSGYVAQLTAPFRWAQVLVAGRRSD